ncbi:MAG: hypothetical protein Q8P41_18745 [Pseudomonadota bacterium]|nr:hypothetical protein [Pseudomonadota bacterium]
MKAISALFALSSLVSAYAAGLLGAVTMIVVGPYLAMGAQMWLGNTEPVRPFLVWPAVPTFVGLLLPVPWLYRKQWNIAAIAALPFALLPFWQLYKLYLLAGAS